MFLRKRVYQSFLAYGPPFLTAIFRRPSQAIAQWPAVLADSLADFPNHSYGIAEDFHPGTIRFEKHNSPTLPLKYTNKHIDHYLKTVKRLLLYCAEINFQGVFIIPLTKHTKAQRAIGD
jgi:hypothetical protein